MAWSAEKNKPDTLFHRKINLTPFSRKTNLTPLVNRVVSIFESVQRVTRSHVLDKDLYGFAGLAIGDATDDAELDIAFDPPSFGEEGPSRHPWISVRIAGSCLARTP